MYKLPNVTLTKNGLSASLRHLSKTVHSF